MLIVQTAWISKDICSVCSAEGKVIRLQSQYRLQFFNLCNACIDLAALSKATREEKANAGGGE